MDEDGTTSILLGEDETALVLQVLNDIPATQPIAHDIVDAYNDKLRREGSY